jgi:hypothetical protein
MPCDATGLSTALSLGALALGAVIPAAVQAGPGGKELPYLVEYYYKVRWGHADEFIRLFRKNHYPVLARQLEAGRILSISAVQPRLHGTEDGRWDYRVTLVFKNVQAAHDASPEDAIKRELFPDQETFAREEQPVTEVALQP